MSVRPHADSVTDANIIDINWTVFMRDMTNLYKVLIGKSEEKRPLGRHSSRWEDNVRLDLGK
jgi:hypothetical protein